MIVSHKHRFIFLKTRGTASTRIEVALSKFCGDDDIITAVAPEDESLRAQHGLRGRQNDLRPLADYSFADWLRFTTRWRRSHFEEHTTAATLKAALGTRVWSSYFKFCVERDPWDKIVSGYHWQTRHHDPRPDLIEFLRGADPRRLSNFEIYAIDGVLAMDRVVRFERFAADLEDVRNLLDLPEPLQVQAPTGQNDQLPHYSQVLGSKERAIIDAVCRREIELFDYGFRRPERPDKR